MKTLPHAIHPVLQEEDVWERAVANFLGPDSELVSVSRWIGDSRVYRRHDRVAVIRSLKTANAPHVNSLRLAGEIFQRLGWEADYLWAPPWEALEIPRIDGSTLESRLSNLSFSRRVRILIQLLAELRKLHAKGIAHRDLRADNLLLERSGRIKLIDFDRSVITDTWTAALADWIGVSPSGLSPNPYPKLATFMLLPKAQSAGRRLRARLGRARATHALPLSDDLQLLQHAWSIAMRSRANAPGQNLAYYALTYKNWHFLGERPWYLRWEAIRRRVPLEGRRLLDLGTNMGLLPTFALLHGAEKATGIDADAEILCSAELVARAFGVEPEFLCVDLIKDPDWETAVADADIVVAMSLLRWLPDNRRVLEFLQSRPEVIYEGHDPLPVELTRMRRSGFILTEVLQETERGRFLLYGRKK